jgi:RNA polymerase sigma-70 factor (ECF subfamily)
VEEFSYAEIAGMLGIPAGTVMSRISRGRRLLFERLKEPEGGERSGGPRQVAGVGPSTK